MTDPAIRPTADTITDDMVDALWEGVDYLRREHYPHEPGDRCTECGQNTPCRTVRVIDRIYERIEEARARAEEAHRLA